MLPFHKRSRVNSSIEIGTDELEAIELPDVRPPSVRPMAKTMPASRPRAKFASFSDEEMTVVLADKRDRRISTSPPPRVELQSPRVPPSYVPRFDRRQEDDEPTMLRPSQSRPLLMMTTPRSVIVDQTGHSRAYNHEVPPPPPSSRVRMDDAPRSSAAVDVASSAHVNAIDMTASLSGSTDISRLRRPTMGWAAGLVALGVLAGVIVAFVARGEGLASAAALVDPSHTVTADVVKAVGAQPQAPVAVAALPGAAAVVQQPQVVAAKPAAPACNADAVAVTPVAPVAPVAKLEKAEKVVVESKPVVAYVAPVHYTAPPVVHRVEQQVREPAAVAVAAPPPAITKPVTKAGRRASGDDMESASAADALAKAQLDAALSR